VRIRWYTAGPPFVLLVAAIGWLAWRGFHADESAARLLGARPREHAAEFHIDAGALRANGLLDSIAGSEASEELDYQFVAETGFDYRRDLDAVAASFTAGDMFVVGNFDEKTLGRLCAGPTRVLCRFALLDAGQPRQSLHLFPPDRPSRACARADHRPAGRLAPSARRCDAAG
jgi:hypothetical protein